LEERGTLRLCARALHHRSGLFYQLGDLLDLGQPKMDEYSAVLDLYPFLPPLGSGVSRVPIEDSFSSAVDL